ncbi:nucleoside triphosphate pyrophosphohydrolase family protein [Bacillus massiliglaciei]|uniref:MazG-like protein n=1 Tax=Bacillus massiliglaciei TaxID=1816693 RepID=UPI000A47743B|nr:MazG-like protein [Bacillus massiliglaciei]
MDIKEAAGRSVKIRELYHQLEKKHHGKEWSIEEDALAFLTDAALVGRLTMAQQERWPTGSSPEPELRHKIGESIWWLIVLAERMGIDSGQSLKQFLEQKEKQLG